MQSWELQRKIQVTQLRIMEFYQSFDQNVYVSFSGGKDSTVLLDLVRRIYPDIEAVFIDTGLEFPEIRNFVKTHKNVTWLKPEMNFKEVVLKYGWCYPSKDVAEIVFRAKGGKDWALNKLKGLNPDDTESSFKQRYKKWAFLVDSPFIISEKCCDVMKKKPVKIYEKQNSLHPIIGTMASEGNRRKTGWKKTGCNIFEDKRPRSMPMSFWTEQDVLTYLLTYQIPYCSVYGDIIQNGDKLETTGEKRTGCMWCPVGCHLEKEPNRFQRMEITHPKQYDYCIKSVEDHGLGLGEFLDYIGVKYTNNEIQDENCEIISFPSKPDEFEKSAS